MFKGSIKFILVAIVLTSIGCVNRENRVEVVNGIELVKNLNKPTKPELGLELKPIYSISSGEIIDDSSRYLTNIHELVSDKEQNIYLLDKNRASVKKYNKNGDFIKAFGRRGDGPGEIFRPSSMALYKDTIYINDLDSRKVVKYDTDGNFIGNNHFGANVPRKIQTTSNGMFTSIQFQFNQGDDNLALDGVLVLSDHSYVDTLRLWERSGVYGETTDLHDFYPEYQVSSRYIYVADNSRDHFRIDQFDHDGKKVREISRSYKRIKMDERDMELIKERFKRSNPNLDSVTVELRYKFAIQDIEVDKDENIWIKPSLEERSADNYGKIYEIYSSKGIFLNRVTIPEGDLDTTIKLIGDRLYLIDQLNLRVKAFNYKLN